MSLKKIAEMTGASTATVSRVLNRPDYHCQDAEMTEKIRRAARELGYVPNASARQLKSGNRQPEEHIFSVDVLLARFHSLEEDAFFMEMFRHLETEFLNRKCALSDILTVPDITRMEVEKKRTRADGLVILGKCPQELVDFLPRRYKGIVAIDRNPTAYKIDEVVCNGANAAETAVEYLLELGHRKIGYIGDCNMEARYTGYYECLLRHKIPISYDYVVSTGQTREEGYRAYSRLAEADSQPTAVFCANDVTALGFLSGMKDMTGRRRKQAYRPAVISIDDIEEAAHFSPMLTTVHIPREDMVHMAVMMLRDRLQGGHREYVRLELPCHLMVRESAGMHVV